METSINLQELLRDVPELRELVSRIRLVSQQINLRGWAEANAGNFSLNVSATLNGILNTNTAWFLVSRTGSRYRDMAIDPLPSLVLVSPSTETIYPGDAKPSSEWHCHHLLHEHFRETGRPDLVVLHSHPASIILLSQMDCYRQEVIFNQSLKQALPELELYLPEGIATTFQAKPGSPELAENSLRALSNKQALIWQGHGLLCTAQTPDLAMDIMEVVEKAAQLMLYRFFLTKMNH